MNYIKRIGPLLLLVALLAVGVTGCKSTDKKLGETPPRTAVKVTTSDEKISDITEDFSEKIKEKEEQNKDTVGWIMVPYTTISDVVVKGEDNQFYHRRNFNKEAEFNGVYYADKRNDFGDGSRADLPINTVIYGHALTDDPESPNYELKFGELHNFRNEEWAAENNYIQFSTEKGNYMYEVISVFLVNSDNPDIPYNLGDAKKEEFHDLVRQEILPRSLYDYGVEISNDDKFVTLSTCLYFLEDGTPTYYPNTYYRYGIMGRLVKEDAAVISNLELTINEDRIIDKDGPIVTFPVAGAAKTPVPDESGDGAVDETGTDETAAEAEGATTETAA